MKKYEIYDKFIDKWQNRLGGVSILNNKAVLNRIALPYEELQNRMQELASREGLTANQRAELLNKVTQQKADMLSNAYDKANLMTAEQRNNINNQIMKLEEKRAEAKYEYDEQKRMENKLRTANLVKGGLTLVGGIAGSFIPSVGTAVGASIGSGIGNAIIGLDKSYHQPEAIMDSVKDMANAYSQWHVSGQIKDINKLISDNTDIISGLSDSELIILKNNLENKNVKGLENLLKARRQ